MFLLIFFMMFFMIIFLYHTVYLHTVNPYVPRKTKQTQQQHENSVYKKDIVTRRYSLEQTKRSIETLQNKICVQRKLVEKSKKQLKKSSSFEQTKRSFRVQRKLIKKSKKQLKKLNMELNKDLTGLEYLKLIPTKRTKCKFCSLKDNI